MGIIYGSMVTLIGSGICGAGVLPKNATYYSGSKSGNHSELYSNLWICKTNIEIIAYPVV
jgi:hypothetical protein